MPSTAQDKESAGMAALRALCGGQWQKAFEALSLAPPDASSDAHAQLAFGLLQLSSGHFRSAFQTLSALSRRYPDAASIAAAAGLAAIAAGETRKAQEFLKAAAEKDQHWALPRLLLTLIRQSPVSSHQSSVINLVTGHWSPVTPDSPALISLAALGQVRRRRFDEAAQLLSHAAFAEQDDEALASPPLRLSLLPSRHDRWQVVLTPALTLPVREEELKKLASRFQNGGQAKVNEPKKPVKVSALRPALPSTRQLSGTSRIEVETAHLGDVSSVRFYVDGEERHTDNQPPYAWDWDTSGERDGEHQITILVLRRDGTVAAISEETVLVQSVAISHQTSSISHQTSSISHQTLTIDHRPSALDPDLLTQLKGWLQVDVDDVFMHVLRGEVFERMERWHEAFLGWRELYLIHPEQMNARGRLRQVRRNLVSAQFSLLPPLVREVKTERPLVALTFDDGPRPYFTEQILDMLDEFDFKATFFVVGKMVERYPQLVREIVRRGHEVASHSYSHENFGELSEEQMQDELLLAEIAIERAGGIHPIFFRPPGGHYNERLAKVLQEQGYSCIMWTSNIAAHNEQSPKEAAHAMAASARAGIIYLLHNGKDMTLYLLPHLLEELKRLGFRGTTVGELLGVKPLRCAE